jgi:hypothetical protein
MTATWQSSALPFTCRSTNSELRPGRCAVEGSSGHSNPYGHGASSPQRRSPNGLLFGSFALEPTLVNARFIEVYPQYVFLSFISATIGIVTESLESNQAATA